MSRGIEAGRAFVELLLRDDRFDAGLRKAQSRLRGFASTTRQLGTTLAGVGAGIITPLAFAVEEASNFQEVMNKFNVVFGSNAKAVKEWGDTYASSVGRSKLQVAEFLAETQDLLKPMGFAADAAAEMSKDVTKLAVDLASFNNMADADVLRDLKAALTGSGEVMKKYGVIVSEAAVKQELLNMGLDPKNVTEMEKAHARWNIILRGTTDAQGDAERSADQFANRMKSVWAEVSNAAVAVGMALIPALEDMLGSVTTWLTAGAQWVEQNQELIPIIAGVGVAAVGLGGVLVTLSVIASGASVALGVLGSMAGLLASPFIAGAALGVALGAAFLWASGAIDELGEGFTDTMDSMGRALQAGGIEAAWEAMWIGMGATALDVIAKIAEAFANLIDSITDNKVMNILEVMNPVLFAQNKIADLASGGLRNVAEDLRRKADIVRAGRDIGIGLLEQQQASDVASRAETTQTKGARPSASTPPPVPMPEDIAATIAEITKGVKVPHSVTGFAGGVLHGATGERREEPVNERGGFDIRAELANQLDSQSPAARAEAEAARRLPWMQDYLEPAAAPLPEDIADAIASISGSGAGPIDLADHFVELSDQISRQTKQSREAEGGDQLLIAAQETAQNTFGILQEIRAGGTLQ